MDIGFEFRHADEYQECPVVEFQATASPLAAVLFILQLISQIHDLHSL
ncbi:putative disease resistance protein RGA2 isoform X2 [Iris pallida]|uniref:Disease resistance protein RGA2 isoform X2 n=1 Tax=Iris pallida TaxID=29817 RepID=A0AAX6HZK0_IRIPA|nr:putative disease resistance protein RGA2 isoform X2 [Iris pallida]KAJ6850187.1 putative disease resistance protein RGA2 isoform X2 [Iris pallida]